jgi:hypothetical protein
MILPQLACFIEKYRVYKLTPGIATFGIVGSGRLCCIQNEPVLVT